MNIFLRTNALIIYLILIAACPVIRGADYMHFLKAARDGNTVLIQGFLEQGIPINGTNDLHRSTALHLAAREGHEDTVRHLVDQGADIYACDRFSCTPLHKAAEKGHLSIVRFFIETAGMPPSLATTGGEQTPVHCAAKEGHHECIRYLIQVLDQRGILEDIIDKKDTMGYTAVHYASQGGHIEVLAYLTLLGEARVDQETIDGKTALFLGVTQKKHLVVWFLLVVYGVEIDKKTQGEFLRSSGYFDYSLYVPEVKKNLLETLAEAPGTLSQDLENLIASFSISRSLCTSL